MSEEAIPDLAAALGRHPEVVLAMLSGSRAGGRPRSDQVVAFTKPAGQ